MLVINCSKVIFYRVVIRPAASHTLLYANHDVLLQSNLLPCAYISILIVIRCCMLIMYSSEVKSFIVC